MTEYHNKSHFQRPWTRTIVNLSVDKQDRSNSHHLSQDRRMSGKDPKPRHGPKIKACSHCQVVAKLEFSLGLCTPELGPFLQLEASPL